MFTSEFFSDSKKKMADSSILSHQEDNKSTIITTPEESKEKSCLVKRGRPFKDSDGTHM